MKALSLLAVPALLVCICAAADKSEAPPRPAPVILTPKPPPEPRINGPRIFGVRPGNPFLYTIPATGERPMTFAVKDLPTGLSVDEKTGRITGKVAAKGEHVVTLCARNARGPAEAKLRIVVGEKIALTPPLGWNSWNCWGKSIDDQKIRAAADGMAASGLVHHGWSYINMDDGWQGERKEPHGALQGNQKFPDMKALCDYVHNLGLKTGIYSTPWRTSYAGYAGGSADGPDGKRAPGGKRGFGEVPFHAQDARQWAEWGIDYLKYDWNPIDVEHTKAMTDALRACGRDIVYSLSNSAPFAQARNWAELSNCWRTTGDIRDTWASVSKIGFSQDRWKEFAGPGHWNDPDMLVVGQVGWGPKLHPTQLTPDGQYTHISLWCLLASPMLLGCDLKQLDEFTLNLLTNDEVLAVNQDPLGKQAAQLAKEGTAEVWAKDMEDGAKAVGLFNLGPAQAKVVAKWPALGLKGKQLVRDLWRQKDVGVHDEQFEADVPSHGVVMVKMSAVK